MSKTNNPEEQTMGRPPGSKNGSGKKAAAKAPAGESEQVEREAPAMQAASSNGPLAEEKRQFLEHYRKHRRALADIMSDAADERGNGRSLLKQFENKGGDPKMLIRMWELTDMSQGEAEAYVAQYLGYAVDVGIRVAFDADGQGNMVDVLGVPTSEAEGATALARAYEEGQTKARDGGAVTDNPKRAGTEEHQQWHRGFSDHIWELDGGKFNDDREAEAAQA